MAVTIAIFGKPTFTSDKLHAMLRALNGLGLRL